jgi:Mg2+ and Co2+ transporter CorA
MLPLTLITSFYGMNIELPYGEPNFVYGAMWVSVALLGIAFLYYSWRRKI